MVAVIYSAGSLAPPRLIRTLSNAQAVQVVSDASFDAHDEDAVLCHLSSSAVISSVAPCWVGAPLFPPCPFTSSSFPPFYFSLFFIGFTYFLLLSIPSLFTRIVPLRYQAGGRRRRPNLVFCCVICVICIP